ncbi:MAG TPA: DUF1232 domain-containing protein [bacterium]|nr:DUF1232 domain-containing protein [bacterium]
MGWLESWKKRAKSLQAEVYALYLASRDPRVPWYAKLLILFVVAYAFSPIDLIPDFIPVLGYLDDLLLLPLGILLSIKLIPPPVMVECRKKAVAMTERSRPKNWIAAGVILLLWLLIVIATLRWARKISLAPPTAGT